MLYAKNDSQRIKEEIGDLKEENKPLLDLLLDLYHWLEDEYDQDVIVTMIYRTQEEQEEIYGKGYKKKSPHQFFHAFDLRSRIYSEVQIKRIEDYLNSKYNSTNYYKWTAKNHKVGNGAFHFHVQYYKNK